MNKKKLALCFSGQFRNIDLGFHHIDKNIIKPNENSYSIDIFIHSWFEKIYFGQTFFASNGSCASKTINTNIFEIIYDLYNPTRLLVEKQIEFNERDYNDRKSALIKPKNTLSKNFSIKRVGELLNQYEKENNFLYDAVVSLRFDFAPQQQIDINNFDLSKVNSSTHGVWCGEGFDVSHGIMNSDLFFHYSQFYDYIDECYRDHNVEFCDERLMHKYLDISKIPYFRNPLLNDYILIRG